MCACRYVCLCVGVRRCLCIGVCVQMSECRCLCACVSMCMSVCKSVCMCVYVCVCVYFLEGRLASERPAIVKGRTELEAVCYFLPFSL